MNTLIGQKYGKLTVVEYDCKPQMRHRWWCICECGTRKSIQENHLKTGNTKSCGCLHRRRGKDSPFFKGFGDIPLDYFSIVKRNSKGGGKLNRSSKEFSITIEDMWNQFLSQGKKCALTGLEIGFDGTSKERKRKETSKSTASLDRIDSTKGYVKGNIQWIHKDVNIMKNDLDVNQFIEYCSLIHEYQSRKH